MVTRNSNRLEIFDSFEIDRTLPKYTKGEEVGLVGSIPGVNGSGNTPWVIQTMGTATTGGWGNVIIGGGNTITDPNIGWNSSFSIDDQSKKPSFWSKFNLRSKKTKENRKKTMTILNFFSSLAQSLNDLRTLQDIGIHYETLISNAAKAGQTALVDKLKLRLESAKSEIQLVVLGLQKFLTEAQVVDFYSQTKKDNNLKLTWIKHFVKPIPSKILELKSKLDEQFVFDNYVILHYDPNNDATDMTKEEKIEQIKREKDPILFGVIKDSRRLYYVGDWIDDYCNLTLDTVIETLQEKVGEINNDTVKTYIDLGERKDVREKLPQQEKKEIPLVDLTIPEKIEKAKRSFTKSVKDFMPKRPMIFQKTSPASKLQKLGKKKK